MPLLTIFIVLIVVGVGLWLVNAYIPMDAKIKKILNIVVVIIVIIWLLKALGLFDSLKTVTVESTTNSISTIVVNLETQFNNPLTLITEKYLEISEKSVTL